MYPLQQKAHGSGARTLRQEVKRFVYMCDGMSANNSRCNSVQVIDACTEREADALALKAGWKVNRARCMCNQQKHVGTMAGNNVGGL